MSDWICPACGGGFPEEAFLDDTTCPWCHWMLPGPDDDDAMKARQL